MKKSLVATVLVFSLCLPAYAAERNRDGASGPIQRIVKILKRLVHALDDISTTKP